VAAPPAAGGAAPRAGVGDWLRLVRFSHTVFALPFALVTLLVATGGRPAAGLLAKVVLAAVAARTAAMAYNRWADRDVDARNPRTAGRELPRGVIRPGQALALAAGAGAAFVAVAFWLQPLCGWLAVPVLALLLGYSHAKRFTAASHGWLGVALGLAPPAAHLAATGRADASLVAPLVLGLGVAAWVAGFDLVYACQDAAFDRAHGLHSLPARAGVPRALRAAAGAHALAAVAFAGYGLLAGLGAPYWAGVAVTVALLVREHRLVRPDDLRRVNEAFFTMNAAVSLSLLCATALDLYVW
jgi:4-hydroxybenzoate polyprenyltransferase